MTTLQIKQQNSTLNCIMYEYDDHKQAIPWLKQQYYLNGYCLIKRSDLSVIRCQKNTRSIPVKFLQIIEELPHQPERSIDFDTGLPYDFYD